MIRVASYCRVSTEKEDQANSFEAQKRYFQSYIENHPDWELAEIYADEGITGTTTKRRVQFNRMMQDAYEGRFQMIITKEVSRFSRNILDTIRYTRELKAIGIGVIFATDRIHTLEPEAEMLLSYLASMAQEESRRTSSRVVWGQTRQMERGVVFGQSLLGYDVKNGQISVNPETAEIVRLIFQKYAIEQVGTSEIARFLTKNGYRTARGSSNWTPSSVIKILKNEKYAGDLVQKKTYTPDFLTHEKKTNTGQVPLITIENHHEAIVSKQVFHMAQSRLQKNNKHRKGEGHSNRYIFSGKIRCAECGSYFVGRIRYRKDGIGIRRWSCATATRGGREACGIGKLIRDDDALQMLKEAVRSLQMDVAEIVGHVADLATEAIQDSETEIGDDPKKLGSEIERLEQKREAMMDSYFSGEISKEEMLAMKRKYDAKTADLVRRQQDAELRKIQKLDCHSLRASMQFYLTGILKGETESQVFCKSLLDSLTVFPDRHMELRLKYLPHIFHFT